MKYINIILFAIILFSISVPNQSQAQNPHSAARVAADLWGKANSFAPGPRSWINDSLLYFWDKKARTSWASMRPQRLDRNKNLTGSVRGKGGEKLVSLPVLDKNSLTITIDETGGKGKTSFTVYAIDKNGRERKIGTKWFNDTDAKKKKTNEKQTFTINASKNQIITISVDGKSTSDTFKYKLRSN